MNLQQFLVGAGAPLELCVDVHLPQECLCQSSEAMLTMSGPVYLSVSLICGSSLHSPLSFFLLRFPLLLPHSTSKTLPLYFSLDMGCLSHLLSYDMERLSALLFLTGPCDLLVFSIFSHKFPRLANRLH